MVFWTEQTLSIILLKLLHNVTNSDCPVVKTPQSKVVYLF